MNASTVISPPALRAGDTIAVCAPAGPVTPGPGASSTPGSLDHLRAGVDCLAARYQVHIDPGVYTRAGYLAGSDVQRAEAFDRCLRNPDVRAIILARGGYGIMRILPLLDPDVLRRDPKPIVGFSDATALAGWVLRCAGVGFIHGPMVIQLGKLPASDVAWLFRLLEQPHPPGPIPAALSPIGAATDSNAAMREGPLVGGNLCVLSHLLGTPYSHPFTGAVLVLEDIGECPYRLDRLLTHLGLADALQGLVATVVGDLIDCAEKQQLDHPDPLAVFHERLASHHVPGLSGLPIGHGHRNLALPLGARAAVDADHGTLHLLEPAVSPH